MKHIILLFSVLLVTQVFSQDLLFKTDSTKLEVKILEINPTEIKYKLFSDKDGSIITLFKSEVALIIYKNGMHEVLSPFIKPTEAVKETKVNIANDDNLWRKREEAQLKFQENKKAELKMVLSTKNLIGLNLFELLNGCIGITYMRELANHHLNISVPINVGFTAPEVNNIMAKGIINNKFHDVKDYVYSRKIIEVGLGVNFQISSNTSTTYFLGPLVDFGQYVGSFSGYTYINGTSLNHYDFTLNRWSFMGNNGFLFRPSKNVNIVVNAAIGVRFDTYLRNDPVHYNSDKDYTLWPFNAFKFGVCMGYKF